VKNILNVEDEVAKAVANEIPVRLTLKQQAELVQSRPVNPEAFDAYMQAYYFFEFFERNTSKDSDMAAKYYERRPNLTGLDIGAVATFTAPPALRSINPRCASLRMTATSLYTFSSLLIFFTAHFHYRATVLTV